jgi:hypothetical protein
MCLRIDPQEESAYLTLGKKPSHLYCKTRLLQGVVYDKLRCSTHGFDHSIPYIMSSLLNVDQILTELTLEEKVQLLSGQDTWSTHPVERLNIPSITVRCWQTKIDT